MATATAGRDAQRPAEIPRQGWRQIAARLIRETTEDRVLLVAAGVTFFLLLAMVPTLSAIVALYSLVTDPGTINEHLERLRGIIPEGAMGVVGEQLSRISEQARSSAGIAFAGSLLLALWSANRGTKSVVQALNVAYDEEEKRGFVRLNLVSLALTLGTVVLLLTVLLVMICVPYVESWLGLGGAMAAVVQWGAAAGAFLLATFGLAALYRWGPSRESARWRWLTPGATVALVIAAVASVLFSWYVANFGTYNQTYGSLGAVIGFMTWLWIMTSVVVLGAELNSEMEHQTARDTTTGPPRPMGARGAVMADRVAGSESA